MIDIGRYRRRNKRGDVKPGDLTSLIDVVFLLLIFFMVTSISSNQIETKGVEVTESEVGQSYEDPLYILVYSSDWYMIDGKGYNQQQLLSFLKRYKADKNAPIAVVGSSRSLYNEVMNAVDPIIESGFTNVSFALDGRQ